MKELSSYSMLLVLTVFLIIIWIPLALTGGVTITEPSIFTRWAELVLLIAILGLSIERLSSWIRRGRQCY